MPGRFVGHRGARDSEWSWERTEEISRNRIRRRWLPAVLLSTAFVAGIAAFAFGIFLIMTNDNGDAAPPVSSNSPSAKPTTTRTPTATLTPSPTLTATPSSTPGPTPSPAPTPSPGPTYAVEFASWSDVEGAWIEPAHDDATSAYAEGDGVPFLLRIENAEIDVRYRVRITYDCVSSGQPAFDYIGGMEDAIQAAVLVSPGPERTLPDSTLIAPDDPSIAYDDEHESEFRAWGAIFAAVEGPSPATECTGAKTVILSLRAQGSTVFLVWTGHLASSADWGPGAGASGATPFEMAIDVNDEVQRSVTMAQGSVTG